MLKFLRRYNKMILVVGGVVLMVVFLLPQAIQQFGPNPQSIVHFHADGKAFRGRDIAQAGKELQNLQEMQQVVGQAIGVQVPLFIPGMSATHWLLLVREADDLGLVGGPEGGRAFLDELATQTAARSFLYQPQNEEMEKQKKQFTDMVRDALMSARARVIEGGTPAEIIDKTLAKLNGVERLAGLAQGLPSLSTREAAYFGREFLNTAVGNIVVIGTGDFESKVPAPSDQELAAFFEKYKSVDPKKDPNGIGYLRPPAVQVEALQVDQSVIRNAIKLDPIEVNKLWRQNQDQYGADFTTARPRVEAALRTTRVEEVMSKVEELIRREIVKATRDLKVGSDGYKELPGDWAQQQVNYEVLAEKINALVSESIDFGQTPPATVLPAKGWLSMAELVQEPASTATATVAGRSMRFPELAMSVRGLDPKSKTGVQTGLTFGPVSIPQYRVFYFRVVGARPESPPDSLAEVREQVAGDYTRLHAYDLVLAAREAIRDQIVASEGIPELYNLYPKDITVREDMIITQDTMTPPEGVSPLPRADTPGLRGAVAKLIEGWDPTRVPEQMPIGERVVSEPLPASLSLAFVIVTGYHPMTIDELRRNDFRVLRTAQQDWTDPNAINPFSFEALKKRLNFKESRPEPIVEGEEDRDPNDITD